MKDIVNLKNLKKKKRVNSKAKGGAFERQIAKMLNERFDTKEFNRTPGSGAFATTHQLPEHITVAGDLITPLKFKFCIECKKGYNDQTIYSLLDYNSKIWQFIEQCEKDAKKMKKVPMIIYKQDRKDTLVITYKDMFTTLIPSITIFKDIKEALTTKTYSIYKLKDIIEDYEEKWFMN
jgi:Holliday junction resolvase|tara:strand:- start:482 stop:1015 length:534 start_codon:yes stop_codon:yes gene_type:complete